VVRKDGARFRLFLFSFRLLSTAISHVVQQALRYIIKSFHNDDVNGGSLPIDALEHFIFVAFDIEREHIDPADISDIEGGFSLYAFQLQFVGVYLIPIISTLYMRRACIERKGHVDGFIGNAARQHAARSQVGEQRSIIGVRLDTQPLPTEAFVEEVSVGDPDGFVRADVDVDAFAISEEFPMIQIRPHILIILTEESRLAIFADGPKSPPSAVEYGRCTRPFQRVLD